MNIGQVVAKQLRQPYGLLGRFFGLLMNRVNHNLNDFMKRNMDILDTDYILEVGFGDGTLIKDMASEINNGKIIGIDFSEVMVAQAKKVNRQYISEGIVDIQQSSIENIPYAANYFNKICSANTIYFWPQPESNAKELYRVLKAGGKLILGFRTKEQLQNTSFSEHGFQLYSEDSVVSLLSRAGFEDVEIVKEPSKKYDSYCAIATKI